MTRTTWSSAASGSGPGIPSRTPGRWTSGRRRSEATGAEGCGRPCGHRTATWPRTSPICRRSASGCPTASARPGATRAPAELGAALAAEKLDRIVLMGDLNSTLDDRGLAPVTSRLTPADEGFGFTWPAAFPLARIDHVMTRAATPVTTWTLPATGSDHLPVMARIKL
ncbi:endonuclease/exonuclease/phosphatase family protein [Nonomuraea ferruginea]